MAGYKRSDRMKVIREIKDILKGGGTFADAAETLNAKEIYRPTGRPWGGPSLTTFCNRWSIKKSKTKAAHQSINSGRLSDTTSSGDELALIELLVGLDIDPSKKIDLIRAMLK